MVLLGLGVGVAAADDPADGLEAFWGHEHGVAGLLLQGDVVDLGGVGLFRGRAQAADDAGVRRDQVLADHVAAGFLQALGRAGQSGGDERGLLDEVDLPDGLDPVVKVVAAHARVELDELGPLLRDLGFQMERALA